MTSTCLLRRNKLKKQKYPSSKSTKTKLNFFRIFLARVQTDCPDLNSYSCADERLNDIVGSAYCVASEVLHTSYSLEERRYMEHWNYNLHFITWKLAFLGMDKIWMFLCSAKSRIKLYRKMKMPNMKQWEKLKCWNMKQCKKYRVYKIWIWERHAPKRDVEWIGFCFNWLRNGVLVF